MKKLQWTSEKRKVKDLLPLDYNPRIRNEKKQKRLSGSLEKFNLVEIPVINQDNRIIAGQRRWEAFYEAGRSEEWIDVRVPNRMLSDDEVREYNLLSNTHAGDWNLPMLEEKFADLYKDIILDLPAMETSLPSGDMLEDKKSDKMVIREDEFKEEPDPDKEPVTRLGDVYELGRHRLICADCTEVMSLKTLMDGKLAQMVFTDPPYNVKIRDIVGLGKSKHAEFKMASGEMNKMRFTRFLEDSFLNLIKYSENGSIHFICMDWKHVNELTTAASIYTEPKNMIVWKKDNGGMGTFYRSQHELIFVYKNGRKKHINNFGLGETGRYRTNVWEYTGINSFACKERENLEEHPTVKPVKLVADAILDCSHSFGIILDVFLGYGTTLIAAEQTGRVCYGSELDPKYCDLVVRRYLRYVRALGLEVKIKRNGADLCLSDLKQYE